ATPEQFVAGLDSLLVRANSQEVCALVAKAARARPDLASRIAAAALTAGRPLRHSRHFKQAAGGELSCELADCILEAATAANPSASGEIRDAALSTAPMPRDCIGASVNAPCSFQDTFYHQN